MEEEPRIKTLCPYCDRVIMFPPHWTGATMCCPDCHKEFTLTEEIQPPVFEKKPDYVKTMCQHCDGPLEYPADGIGTPVFCPHCGKKIRVGLPSEQSHRANLQLPTIDLTREQLAVILGTTVGMLMCAYLVASNDDTDYQQHPVASIVGSMMPALVIGGIWYYQVVRKLRKK